MERFFKTSTVYTYYLPKIDAIKVGFGDNPKSRMVHYCKTHNLTAEILSLRSWNIPAASVASALESAIHKGLSDAGFTQIDYVSSSGRAEELFALKGKAYDDAVLFVAEHLDILTGRLVEKLGSRHADSERRNQAIQRTKQKQKERQEQEANQEQIKNTEFASEWEHGWDEFIRPWCEYTARCKEIHKSYKPPGIFYGLKHGDDLIPHYLKWPGLTELLTILPSYFMASRAARGFRERMSNKYGGRNNPPGWDMSQPCKPKREGYEKKILSGSPRLWFLNYTDKNNPDWIRIEVGRAASHVLGLAPETSLELLKRDVPEMLDLLTSLAKESLPPEFSP